MKSYGLECVRQRFAAVASVSLDYAFAFVLAPLSAVLFHIAPGLGLAAALACVINAVSESMTRPLLSRLAPKRQSVNAIAKVHARSKELRRLIVLTSLCASPGRSAVGRRGFLPALAGACAILVLYGIAVLVPNTPVDFLWYISLIPSVYIAGTILFQPRQGRTDEADGAPGMAALLETARAIARAPLLTTSIWFVAAGAGAAGARGAVYLARECCFDPKRTMAVNLDGLAQGGLALCTLEGLLLPLHAGESIVEAAGKAAEEKGIALFVHPCRLKTTAAAVFMNRRIPAATITSVAGGEASESGDEHPGIRGAASARDLLLGMIRRLGE